MGSDGNNDGVCRDCGQPVWWDSSGTSNLVTRDGNRWCFGPGRTRVSMERHHALPGMAQYVVPSPEGKVCHCLARDYAHVHQITRARDTDL
jgi:hypothetical protein